MTSITPAIMLLGLAIQPASAPPDGPSNRRVSIASSDDGQTFTSQGTIAERVGKPDIIELAASTPKPGLAKGDWYLVAIDGRDAARAASRLCALRSTDGGTTWGAPTPVEVADWPGSWTARSCSVVQLADARLRVYLEVDATPAAPAPADPGRPIGIPPNAPIHPSLPTPPKKPEFPERPGQPRTNMPLEEVTRRIVSAVSDDGVSFVIEPGDRL